jgi:2-desacetyl-2-hydroxyethyl bacteriochlorophyllide A dehydrogenase
MKTMPLVQIHGVDDVRIDTVDVPEPGPNDALIKVAACGICGSDLGYIARGGLTAPGVPMPLGHELSGTVAALGENVSHLAVGQNVTVNPMANGHAIGNGGAEGAFAPWLQVKDVANTPAAVLRLPEGMNLDQAALIEPLSVAMHGVHQSGIEPGQTALVMGAGPIGLCTVVVLKYYGVERIVVADRSAGRLDVARQLGAEVLCNVSESNLENCLREAHGEAAVMGMPVPGTDVYIEATGVGAVLEQAIGLAREGATIVVLGVHKAPIEFHPLTLLIKELRLVGSMAYPSEFPQVIDMLQGGAVDIAPLISHRFELKDFHQALAVARDPDQAVKVLITMD